MEQRCTWLAEAATGSGVWLCLALSSVHHDFALPLMSTLVALMAKLMATSARSPVPPLILQVMVQLNLSARKLQAVASVVCSVTIPCQPAQLLWKATLKLHVVIQPYQHDMHSLNQSMHYVTMPKA